MLRFINLILAFILLFISTISPAQSITVGTYNLRYDNAADVGNLWKDRSPIVVSLILFYNFDILGTQEGLSNQLEDINTALPIYSRYGVGRDDGMDAGEHSAIFYKKDRFILKDKGDFWLSETPTKPTLGWDARCCKRICSWVQLKDKQSGKMLWVFNAHYDHEGKVAREESSKLILKKIREIAGDNMVIMTGDLNGGHATDCYKIIATSGILYDTYSQAPTILHSMVLATR